MLDTPDKVICVDPLEYPPVQLKTFGGGSLVYVPSFETPQMKADDCPHPEPAEPLNTKNVLFDPEPRKTT
jgi:hypothetical protein